MTNKEAEDIAYELSGIIEHRGHANEVAHRCEEDSIMDEVGNILCEDCTPIEITWTNYAGYKAIHDRLYIVREKTRHNIIDVFPGHKLGCNNEGFEITEYTPEKWGELND